MQCYASCLLPSLLRRFSCLLFCFSGSGSSSCTAISLCQPVHCSGLLQPLLYKLILTVYAGIVCLYCVSGIVCLAFKICDWLPLHYGIACLASLASNCPAACWDSLSRLLHAGIVCLTSLASDWPIACWDNLFLHSMLG